MDSITHRIQDIEREIAQHEYEKTTCRQSKNYHDGEKYNLATKISSIIQIIKNLENEKKRLSQQKKELKLKKENDKRLKKEADKRKKEEDERKKIAKQFKNLHL